MTKVTPASQSAVKSSSQADCYKRNLSFLARRPSHKGVANGKCETLRDRETTDFLCEPETF